jgi:hypothetical protein
MIKVIDNFLTKTECGQYIERIEKHINEKNVTAFTDHSEIITDKRVDIITTDFFFKRLIECLPDFENIGANNLVMFAKYIPGTQFGLHTDTGLFYDRKNKIKSKYTLLIYLNDDYNDGETIFYPKILEGSREQYKVVPKTGSAIIFEIENNYHEGANVTDGIKYWIGCEILGKF